MRFIAPCHFEICVLTWGKAAISEIFTPCNFDHLSYPTKSSALMNKRNDEERLIEDDTPRLDAGHITQMVCRSNAAFGAVSK